jgi:glycosyltransferase involved in cell wall biosynthesis
MTTDNPYFSIIIPTFNRANDLKRALHSIKIQSFEDWEIIVVDNNSIDNTLEIINQFPLNKKISYFLIENFGVIGKSRNLGISKAKGKYIAFLDSDDWWHEDKLSADFVCLENGADLVYSDFYRVNSSKEKKIVKVRDLKDNITIDLLKNGNAICNSSVVVRKSIIDKVGFINEGHEFNAWVDFDLWLRISKITNRFVHINQPLVYYWFGGGNISTTSENPILTSQAIRRTYIRKTDIEPLWLYSSIGSGLFFKKKYKKSIPYLSKAYNLSSGLMRIKILVKITFSKIFSYF